MEGKKVITVIQVVLAIFVVAGVGWLVFKLVGYNQAQQVYRQMQTQYAPQRQTTSDQGTMDFTALQQQYPHVVGWLQMDDVDINYPIVQGKDNDYYLHHDPSDASNIDGSIFLDYRNKSLSKDLYALVYGHNMQDESMFGKLDEYTKQEFYQNGSGLFRVYTPEGTYRYKIFAVNIVDPSDATYETGFTNSQAFDAFVKQLKERSMYDTGVEVSGSDYVITLSTCSDSNRLALSAKRI